MCSKKIESTAIEDFIRNESHRIITCWFIICNLFFSSQRRYVLCKIRIPTLTFWLRTTFVELQVGCYAPVLHGSFPLITLPIMLCNKQDLISRPYCIIIIISSYAYFWVQSSMNWSAWWVYFYYYKT